MMSLAVDPVPTHSRPAFSRWRLYLQRYRTRQALLLLDDAQLADIGLTSAAAWQEGCKPFWRR
ncbi:Uncharacterized conserved small protein [Serratia quinivorans]|uniref:DUF1127 domain-containing protein n=1 Tax=Serratia quinivorans TaxID=137545 RepID=UPI0021777FB4|nr:DUF1127 domain-containing protein [Serratia quinivorans]CAI1140523.1 Uncharacterized conserved small protein [Serratia quinivorans]